MWYALLALALFGTASSTVFLILALVAARRYRRYAENASRSANAVPESTLPPVTLLKPVHGMEPRLHENLESFFRQNYPDFEIIFGARSADNAALSMSVEMTSGVLLADMLEGMRFALGAVIATNRQALEKIGGIAATADYYSDDFVLGNLVWAADYNIVLSHYIVDHVLIPSSFLRTFGHQIRWMKSTRYSRPRGHLGSGLTYAVPFGLLGLISPTALGHPVVGIALLGYSILNRIIQSLAIGWSVDRDPRALRLCWLYPFRDLLGFITWAASYTSRSFFWRGETYHFTPGGKIVPQQRAVEDALVNQP